MVSKNSKAKSSKNVKNVPNAKPSSSETKDEQDDIVIQSLSVAISAINATKDLVPIDLAKGILGTVANILTIAQLVIKNKSDFQAIVDKCETIREILGRSTKDATDDDLPGYLRHALSQLNISVNRINSEVSTKKEQGFFKRLFSVTIDRDHISGWEKDLDRVLVLFNFEAIAGIAIDVKFVKKVASQLEGNAASINVPKYRPKGPPPRPAMFYGRDDLVAELTNLVINDEHIALIGAGGMGKSSLAKAILNETLVRERFADRRYFVTYDDLDPFTITFDAFMTRFAGILGIELAGADPVGQISSFLCITSALVVLDNAETFEEASISSALSKIPAAIAEIADIPGVILILTSRSRRIAPNVEWITKDIPPLDLSAARQAFFRIYRPASVSNAEGEITKLLAELDFHPLSINLLANAAQQSGWSPATLLERWNNRHSIVLNHSEGKLQSLSYTMNLSLGSPSVQELGEDGRRALAVIAFLPQGLNADLASDLLPSLLHVDTICDVLCRQSLVYRQESFIKVLAPIRHFVRHSLPPLDSTCLRDIRDFYYDTVGCCSEDRDRYADMIISNHLNIEHVVAFNLAHVPDGKEETYKMCRQFLWCLKLHLPRPTTLAPAIFNIVENSSTWVPKRTACSS
ncbi:P-loop containing nucleoside triphosphate hydrolase protein [Suillus ampliporus]|nr:P-loop containing nucleoside triphosphate hydrolase protein [Suillus ampliporus]